MRRRRTPVSIAAVLIVTLLAACGGSKSNSSATTAIATGDSAPPGTPDACKLLSTDEVNPIIGGPYDRKLNAGSIGRITCAWLPRSANGNGITVLLEDLGLADQTATGFLTTTLVGASPVSGIGDQAVQSLDGRGVAFISGNDAVLVRLLLQDGTRAKAPDTTVALARAAAGRVKDAVQSAGPAPTTTTVARPLTADSACDPPPASNKLVNGDAEVGKPIITADELPNGISGWTARGNARVMSWNNTIDGAPNANTSAPQRHGRSMIMAGPGTDEVLLSQAVPLATDTGTYTLCGWLGGGRNETTRLAVDFIDRDAKKVGGGAIDPVLPSDRGGDPGLVPRLLQGHVPAGAVEAIVTLQFDGNKRTDNLGAADNVSFSLQAEGNVSPVSISTIPGTTGGGGGAPTTVAASPAPGAPTSAGAGTSAPGATATTKPPG